MNKREKRLLIFLFFYFLMLILLRRNIVEKYENQSQSMKLVFVGDCMFGRDNNPFTENPFVHVEHILTDSSHIFLNLETTISPVPLDDSYKDDKVFNYQATGEQLVTLRGITGETPIFAAIVNNHTLDYKEQGFENTKQFLTQNNIHFTVNEPLIQDGIVFFNATDHCGCRDDTLWKQHLDMVDYNNLEPIYEKVMARARLSYEDGVTLWKTHDLLGVGYMANIVRERLNGDKTYFIHNRHINPTNVCVLSCQFCAFGVKADHPQAYEKSLEEIFSDAEKYNGGEVSEFHIVGGLHPDYPFEYYLDLLKI